MAKKTLNEAVVRRFQKLANVAPINEMYSKYEEGYMQEEEEAPEAPAPDLDAGPDAEEDKMDDMPPMDGDADDMSAEVTEKAIEDAKAGVEAISDLLSSILPDGADDGDMDDMPPMDSDEDDLGGDDDMTAALQEALSGISYVPSQGEIVNEVAQRVARRLKAAKLHEAKLNKALGRK